MMEDNLKTFINRLKKININVELVSNYPWVYIYKINGNLIKEKFLSDYGFTVAYLPIKKDQNIRFNNISEIFKLIRKYV